MFDLDFLSSVFYAFLKISITGSYLIHYLITIPADRSIEL